MILISPYSKKMVKEIEVEGKEGIKEIVEKTNAKNYPWFQEIIDKIKEMSDYKIVQIGVSGEKKLDQIDEYFFDKSLKEIKQKIIDCDFWISIDSMLQHLASHTDKRGVVLWGKSDPKLFGYPQNLNLLKDRKYLRPDQFFIWDPEEFDENVFMHPSEVALNMIKEGFLRVGGE